MIKIKTSTWKYVNLFKTINNSCLPRFLSITQCKCAQESIELKEDNTRLAEGIRTGSIKISTNLRTKQPRREPLLKNLFVGVVDKDLLAYPESITNEDIVKLEQNNHSLKSFIESQANSSEILKSRQLRDLISFGLNTPQTFRGLEYNLTETLLTNEIESQQTDLSILLNAHRAVTQIIVEHGSDKIKQKYLEKLSTGELTGTFALFEESLNEEGTFNTKASLRSNETVWTINGTKNFVVSGLNPSLYLVFANTRKEDFSYEVSAFLVEANNVNILRSEPNKTFGCLDLKEATITLNNVEVPKENCLGNVVDGSEIGEKLLRITRIQTSVVALIKMKTIFSEIVKQSLKTNLLGVSRIETELIQNRLGALAIQIYAAESIIYHAAGLIDNYDGQDVDLESIVLKIFSLETLLRVSLDAIHTKGVNSFYQNEQDEIHFRDSIQMLLQGEQIDALKQYIAMAGLKHAGLSLNETVKKARNPLFHPGFTFSKFFERDNVETPKLKLNLNEYLHPSLDPAAQWLEESIVRLQMGVEIVLSRYGAEVHQKQIEIARLADAAVLVYAMFASVSRASRSYCIGLHNSDYDMLTASAFTLQARNKVKTLITEISDGPFLSSDLNLQKIGRKVFHSKGYFWEHPTKRNY